MSTSEDIRKRLKEEGISFKSNDNIAGHIRPDELMPLQKEIEQKVQALLETLLIDTTNDPNTFHTAKRMAHMYLHEIFEGRYFYCPGVTSFPADGYKGMYISGPISIDSTCAHHFQNIIGKCWVGIIPSDEVIGLSKFNRIANWIARRPQIQEAMTRQIAEALQKYAKTKHIAVVLKAEHQCTTQRGVKEHESDMTTAIMKGKFLDDDEVRKEFYDLLHTMKGIKNG